MGPFAGQPVGLVGGDRRTLELASLLVAQGACVRVAGFAPELLPPGVLPAATVGEAAGCAWAVILPLSGTDDDGRIRHHGPEADGLRLDERSLRLLQPRGYLVTGRARPGVRLACQRLGLQLVELLDDEEFLLRNAVVTAEGALELAMSHLPVTLHGSASVVVGVGRCGQQLVRLLGALGSRVIAVGFRPEEHARAEALGARSVEPRSLAEAVEGADVIFNTAPALVVTEGVLARMSPQAILIDIASEPGGVDRAAAARLGRVALHIPGIPGKTAPRTAARITLEVLRRRLQPDAASAGQRSAAECEGGGRAA